MKFSESMLAEMLRYPRRCYRMGGYGFILHLPVIAVVLTLGVLIAVFIDFLMNPHPFEQ